MFSIENKKCEIVKIVVAHKFSIRTTKTNRKYEDENFQRAQNNNNLLFFSLLENSLCSKRICESTNPCS